MIGRSDAFAVNRAKTAVAHSFTPQQFLKLMEQAFLPLVNLSPRRGKAEPAGAADRSPIRCSSGAARPAPLRPAHGFPSDTANCRRSANKSASLTILGTLCCPPSLPLLFIQALNVPGAIVSTSGALRP